MGAYDDVLGTLLVGIIVNTYLYGIVTFQFASYRNTAFHDPLWIKLVVLALFLIDTVHSASVVYLLWVLCIENFTNPAILARSIWPLPLTPIAITLSASLAQTFLSYRIWRLTGSLVYFVSLLAMISASLGLGLTCGVKAWQKEFLSEYYAIKTLATWWLSAQVAIDVVITTTLIAILSRSRTGFRSTDTIINRLIRGCIQSGLLCGIISLLSLIFFLTKHNTNHYSMLAITIGRVYTNTLLDTLLVRDKLRGIFSTTYGTKRNHNHDLYTQTSLQLRAQTEVQTETTLDQSELRSHSTDRKPDETDVLYNNGVSSHSSKV